MKTTKRGLRRTAGGLLLTMAVAGFGLACNENPVTFSRAVAGGEYIVPTTASGTEQLDMLWVVDDSGSMCQEQKVLRENFDAFIQTLETTNLDVHLAVTTTDMRVDPETPENNGPVGKLVNVPNPAPGVDQTCLEAVDANGNVIQGDYSPIRDALEAAVACLKPGVDASRYTSWTDADIRCAVDNAPGCTIQGVDCQDRSCEPELLFPPAGEYRAIPKVIRSSDPQYQLDNGALNIPKLKEDFGCMSLVGASGYGIEAGLGAAIKAVSPELTGGPAGLAEGTEGVDTSAPNHGLLRKNARFALVFVTDENDCSIDPQQAAKGITLPEPLTCGDDHCDYEALKGDNGPLYTASRAHEDLMANLRESKQNPNFDESQVLVASIHGQSKPFTGDPLPSEGEGEELSCRSTCNPRPSAGDTTCPEGFYCEHRGSRYACSGDADCLTDEFCECPDGSGSCPQKICFPDSGRCRIQTSCATQLGISFSGDRYESFLKSFPETNYFPQPTDPEDSEAALTGWMCRGDFTPALEAIGKFIIPASGSCITNTVLPCSGPGDVCPDFPYSGTAGTCTKWPASDDEYYCDSGLQLRIKLTEDVADPATVLRDTGYCLEASIGDSQFPRGCVVSPDKFSWIDCPSGAAGLKLQWADQAEAEQVLRNMEVQIRYSSITSSEQ